MPRTFSLLFNVGFLYVFFLLFCVLYTMTGTGKAARRAHVILPPILICTLGLVLYTRDIVIPILEVLLVTTLPVTRFFRRAWLEPDRE